MGIQLKNIDKNMLDILYKYQVDNAELKKDHYIKLLEHIIERAKKYINDNGILDLNGYDLLNILEGVDND